MHTRSLILLLLILSIPSLNAQQQISSIENVTHGRVEASHGFVLYEGKEYFIERNEIVTRISLLEEDKAIHLHDVFVRPKDGKPHYTTDFRYSNSGILVNNNLIYEIYDFNIYVINFVTGELVSNIELCEHDIQYAGYFSFFDDTILFRGEKSDAESYFVYDIELNLLEELNWTKEAQVFPADQWIYSLDENNSRVTGYNVERRSFDFEMELTESIESISVQFNLLIPHLKITTSTRELIEIKEGEVLYRSDCFKAETSELIHSYFREGIIYASLRNGEDYTVVAKDITTCEDAMIFEELEGSNFKFLDNKVLDTRYLLFSAEVIFPHDGIHYIVDIEGKSYNRLEAKSTILKPYETIVENGIVYIMGRDVIYFHENPGYIYLIELQNLTDKPVEFNETYPVQNLVFSEKYADEKLYILWGVSYSKTYVGRYHLPENNTEIIDNQLAEQNRGIMRVSRGLEVSGKYYYMDDFGIYTLSDDKVELLIESNANMPMTEKEGNVVGIVGIKGESYLFEINTWNNSWDTTRFDGNGSIDPNSRITPYAVVHPRNHPHGGGLIDFETKEFIAFRELLGGSNYRIFGMSGENAFLEVSSAAATEFIIVNTRTREFFKVETIGHRYARSPSDGNGGFYLLEVDYDPKGDRKVLHVDGSGNKLGENTILYSRPFTKKYFVETQDFTLVPLPGDDEVHLFMAKKDETKIQSVPFQEVTAWNHLLIRNDDDYIVMVNEIEGAQTITQLSFDEAPITLTELQAYEECLEILLTDEKIALFIHEGWEDRIRIEILDRTTKQLLRTERYQISKESDPKVIHLGNLNDTLSLFNFKNQDHGEEGYLFNVNDGSFSLLADIAPGHLDGSPADFLRMNGSVYFTSLTEDRSRQWFKLKINDHLNLSTVNEFSPIKIFPNPTSDVISFEFCLSEYEIFSAVGISCLRSNDFNQIEIDVSILPNGHYSILAKVESGEQVYGNFIVQR
ncbi:MAG: hypothetical protein AAGA77_06530 [Bacteroidota bacterium]